MSNPLHKYHDEYRIIFSGRSKKFEEDEHSFFQKIIIDYIQSAILLIVTAIYNQSPNTKLKVIKINHITKEETTITEL